MKTQRTLLLAALVATLALTSCVTPSQVNYLQDMRHGSQIELENKFQAIICPYDELDIYVFGPVDDEKVTKPFNILEVKARIKAIIRRTKKRAEKEPAPRTIVSGDMKIELDSRRVFIGEKEVNLTAKEFDLLELLITNPNKVFNRENLLDLVWGFDYPGDVRTVDVHVRRLREKIEANPSEPKYIHTKWGVGYYFQK